MRWPWQQRKTAPESPARPHAEWRQAGGLRPTVDPHPPTLIPAGLPVIASTRSLLHRDRTSPDVPPVPPGRVSGLTSVFPAVPSIPATEPEVRVAVVARTHRTVTLTRAVAEYVGEARVPAVPHRAPAWLKSASDAPQVITPLDAFVTKPAEDGPVRREVAMLDAWSNPAIVVPSEPESDAAPDESPVTPPVPMIRRRRRPGLGLPLPPGERPPAPTSTPIRTPAAIEPPKPTLVRPETPKPEPVSVPAPTSTPTSTPTATPTAIPIPEPVPEPVVPVAEGAAGPELVHRVVVPGRFSGRIPNDIVQTFERSYGVEVADVTVDRSPAAAAEAKAIGAKAFARDDLIVLPEEAGPVESVETRALIGHELAHVVQQRTIGTMPTESDADGQRLEAAARSVEEWVRAGAAGPPPPVIPPTPPRPGAPPEATERPGPVPVRRRASAGPPSGAGAPQRAVTGVATDPAPTTATNGPRVTTSTAPTTTASTTTAPSLVHPRGTTDTHPENPHNAHEFGTLLRDSLAGMGADMFGFGGLLGHSDTPATPQTPRATTSTTTSATTGTPSTTHSTTGTTGTPGATFNRDRRREQLTNDTLDRLNVVRAEQGQAPLTELPPTEAAAIESQLDAEQSAGGASGTGTDAPVIHNWHEFSDQFRLAGGELVGSLFGINPVEMADRHRQEEEARHQQQQQQQGTHTASTVGAAAGAGAGAAAQSVGHPDRPATPDPTGAELARLYDRIHTRLVRELLVGRERAGSLMDFR